MMCQRIGRPPISTIGFGRTWVSSLMRVPNPPARMTAFMDRDAIATYGLDLRSAFLEADDRAQPLGRPREHRSHGARNRAGERSANRVTFPWIVDTEGEQAALQRVHDDR